MSCSIGLIGAGISSAVFCKLMKGKANINVFEKSRGTGGRLSRHYNQHYCFDLGSQDLILSKKNSNQLINEAICDKALLEWKPTFRVDTKEEKTMISLKDIDCYCGNGSMNQFVKWLFGQTKIVYEAKITKIIKKNNRYYLNSSLNKCYGPFDMIVLSCPSPQIGMLTQDFDKELESVEYNSCMVINLGIKETLPTSIPEVVKSEGTLARWLIQTHLKPNACSKPGLTIQSKELEFDVISHNKETLSKEIINEVSDIYKCQLKVQYEHVHIWRYSQCVRTINKNYLFRNNVGLIGDCFKTNSLNSSIESCIESATALSKHINDLL